MNEFDDLIETLMEDEAFKAEYLHHVAVGLAFGSQGFGKGMGAKRKMIEQYWHREVPNTTDERTEMPQKVCNYRKPTPERLTP